MAQCIYCRKSYRHKKSNYFCSFECEKKYELVDLDWWYNISRSEGW